ncbi:MAG: LamG-like jellyroll fold domain-containing protein, partial [Pseudomonadota bacterium]
DLLANDSDADGDSLSIIAVDGPATLQGDKIVIDTSSPLKDSFFYTVSDGNGGTSKGRVSFDVKPLPNADVDPADGFGLNAEIFSYTDTGSGRSADAARAVTETGTALGQFTATYLQYGEGQHSFNDLREFVSHDAASNVPDVKTDNLAFRFTGFIEIPEGEHKITVKSDDGFVLDIGGVLFSEHQEPRSFGSTNLTETFDGGLYALDLTYYEGALRQGLHVEIDGQIVDASQLFQSTDAYVAANGLSGLESVSGSVGRTLLVATDDTVDDGTDGAGTGDDSGSGDDSGTGDDIDTPVSGDLPDGVVFSSGEVQQPKTFAMSGDTLQSDGAMSVWFKPELASGYHLFKAEHASGSSKLDFNEKGIFSLDSQHTGRAIKSSGQPDQGTWNHFSVVFSDPGTALYLNGEKIGERGKYDFGLDDIQSIILGENFAGEIAGLDIYDTPLTADEIAVIVARGPEANVAPIASDDSGFAVETGAELRIPVADLLANDSDGDGDTLSISDVTGAVLDGDEVVFSSDSAGDASFKYSVSDGQGGSDTASVSVTVNEPAPSDPIAAADPILYFAEMGAPGETIDNLAGDDLNGVVQANGWTLVDDSPKFDLAAGTLALSFKASDLDATYGLWSRDSSGNDGGGHQSVSIQNGKLVVRMQDTSNSYTVSAPVDADTDTAVALRFGPGGMQLFLDGVLVDSNSYTGGMQGNDEPVVIGAAQWRSGNGVADRVEKIFNGEITKVALFDTVLSDQEVAAIAAFDGDSGVIDPVNTAPVAGDDTATID